MSPLSTTAEAVLATADADHVVTLPDRLPIAARRAVVKSMLTAGLLEEAPAGEGQSVLRTNESGKGLMLRATQAGLAELAAGRGEEGPTLPPEDAASDSDAEAGQHPASGPIAKDPLPSPRTCAPPAAMAYGQP